MIIKRLVLDVEPTTFRKRLSRARADLIAFAQAHCGIVNGDNACRCHRRISHALRTGRIEPQNLRFAKELRSPGQFDAVVAEIGTLEENQRVVALYRAQPEFQSAEDFAAAVRTLLDPGEVRMSKASLRQRLSRQIQNYGDVLWTGVKLQEPSV